MFSNHCQHRNQQRCIPPVVHKWLSEYGEKMYDGHGGIQVFFSLKSKSKMEQDFGRHFVRENKKYLKIYRVESCTDGVVITTGWRNKKFKNR